MEKRNVVLKNRNLAMAVFLIVVLALTGVLMTMFTTGNSELASAAEAKKMMAFYDFKDGEGGLNGFTDSTGLNQASLKGVTLNNVQANNETKSKFLTSTVAGATDTSYFHWEQSGKVAGGGGLTLAVAGELPTYTIGLKFSLSTAGNVGYQRIMDFKNRTTDSGFYFYRNDAQKIRGLNFYPLGNKDFTVTKNEVVDLIISRSNVDIGDNIKKDSFYVYAIKGGKVSDNPVYETIDTVGNAVPTVENKQKIFHFFNDGSASSEFSPIGDVYSVKLWDSVLTRDEIVESLKPTVVFIGNGGEGSIGDQSNTHGTPANLTKNTFSRGDNCTFAGWNTKADGTGVSYADETSYPFTESATLYAMWRVDTVSEQTALCVSQNGDDTAGLGTPQKPYRTIDKAYTEAKEGDTIYIIGDIELAANVALAETKSVTIKGLIGNEVIKRTGTIAESVALFSLSGGKLSLINITVDGGATWGENGASIGSIPQGRIIEVKESSMLMLDTGTILRNSAAGAVTGMGTANITLDGATIQDCYTGDAGAGIELEGVPEGNLGGSPIFTMNSGAIRGCRAEFSGGGIYSVGTSQIILKGGVITNNSAKVGGGIIAEEGLEINPNAVTVTDEIVWANDKGNSIILTAAPTATAGIFTIRCNKPADGTTFKVIDGIDESEGYNGEKLKPHFKMANAGYTFEYKRAGIELEDATALYISATRTPVAAQLELDGTLIPDKSYLTLQSAIDGSASGDTIYLLTSTASTSMKLYESLIIESGKNLVIKSGNVKPNSDASDFIYAINAEGSPMTLMRGENFTAEMFSVNAGGTLTLENIVIDGGAVWGSEGIKISGVANTYYVTTNNLGVKANAPILAVQGALTLGQNATLTNNENSYSVFGSENYGGAVRVFGTGATFVMGTDSVISNCYAREGGAVMNVTKFTNVDGSVGGGSKFTMEGGIITGCVSQAKGSAVQTIYGNAVTEIKGGSITGLKPHENNYGVMTVEEGGSLIISGGTITNSVAGNSAVYVYNQYINSYSGYLEGLHAAELKLLGGSIVGSIGLDASGTAETTGTHPKQVADISEKYLIFVDTVAATSTLAAETYSVLLNGNWRVGDKIVNGSGATFSIDGFTAGQFVFVALDGNTIVGGMEISDSFINADGTITVIGKLVGDSTNLKVTVGVSETTISVTGDTFTATTKAVVAAGKNEVKAIYTGGGDKFVSSKMGIIVPQVDADKNLTGEINYGTLENGDVLQYKSTDGSYKTYIGTDLPNDIAIGEDGFTDFKLVESGGAEYDYRAYIGKRVIDKQPGDSVLTDSDVTRTHNSITVTTKVGYEYRLVDRDGNVIALDGKNWNVGVDGTLTYEGLNPDTAYTVEVRVPGTETSQPGKTASVNVTTKSELEQSKADAKAELDAAATAAKAEINGNANLSTAEKLEQIAAVDAALTAAKDAINGATIIADVATEQGNGETAIGVVKTAADELGAANLALANAKDAAKAELDKAAKAATDAINANANLSDKEKAEQIVDIDVALETAKTAIGDADSLANVAAEQGKGETAIGDVTTAAETLGKENLATAQTKAKGDLTTAADTAKAEINANPNLSDDEKTAKIADIDTALANAKTAVGNADSLANVATEQDSGTTAIELVKTAAETLGKENLTNAKAAAITVLETEATAARKAITDNANLSDVEKETKTKEIDTALATAKDAFDSVTTIEGVKAEQGKGTTEIGKVKTDADKLGTDNLATKKSEAVTNLTTAAKTATDAINGNANLSAAEKETKVAAVETALANAKTAVGNADSLANVATEQDSGKSEIGKVKTAAEELGNTNLDNAKDAAKAELDKAATAAKAEINGNANLSTAEKLEQLAAVETALTAAKDAINGATIIADVTAEQGNGETAIGKVKTDADKLGTDNLATKKSEAITNLTTAAKTATDAINGNTNLSDVEKAAKIADIDTALTAAKEAIDSKTIIADIATEQGKGETAIGAVKTAADKLGKDNLVTAKATAITALTTAATAAKEAITENANLTTEQIAEQITAVTDAFTAATAAINSATIIDNIEPAQVDGIAAIGKVKTAAEELAAANLATKKSEAITNLTTAADTAKDTINANPNLSADEKTAKIADIDTALDDATAAVNGATTLADVATEQGNGETAIGKVKTDAETLGKENLATKKSEAITNLTTAADTAKEAINANKNLSADEKTAKIADIDTALGAAKEAVGNADSLANVATEQDSGTVAIGDATTTAETLGKENLTNAKAAAITVLETEATAARKAITDNANLSDVEKETKTKEIDTALATAKDAFDSVTTIEGVKAEQGKGTTEIGKVKTAAEELGAANLALANAKTAAKAELATAADTAKDAINANSNLSDVEKAAKIADIDTALANATTAVNGATTLANVATEQDSGTVAIGDATTAAETLGKENLTNAKAAAITVLETEATAAKKAITDNENLTPEQITEQLAAVDTALETATAAVNGATIIADIKPAKVSGTTAIALVKTAADELAAANLAAALITIEDEFNKFVADNCKDSKYTAEDLTILKSKIASAKDKLVAITKISDLDKWLADSIADAKTVKEKAPVAQVDRENDCLIDLVPGNYQVIAGGTTYTFTVGEDGKLSLQGKDNVGQNYDFANQKISLIKNGENGFADSNKQEIALPTRVAKPENVSVDEIIVDEKSITIKGETVVSGNKYAVVDNDGNILSSGWTVGSNGTDIVFDGLESGKQYRVVVIGKNSNEPTKLPSNPSNGTTITTKGALETTEKDDYIWVILCSIFGVLFVVECLYIFVFRKKKNNKNNNHKNDGGRSNLV